MTKRSAATFLFGIFIISGVGIYAHSATAQANPDAGILVEEVYAHPQDAAMSLLSRRPTEPVRRTWSQPNYEADPMFDPNHQYGDFYVRSNYQDPDFRIAAALPNPLHDSRYDSYNLIVVINKEDQPNEPGQTMRVYLRGQGLVYFWWVSTANTARGKVTENGYFRPQGFSSGHRSSLYNGAPMPWAVFFNGNIATHGVPDQAIDYLGQKVSAGCVRLEPQRGEDLFHLIGQSGQGHVDRINQYGDVVYGNNGLPSQVWSYKTLFIVK